MGNTDKERASKVYGIDKWKEIRKRINGIYELNEETSGNWKEAVEIFSRRLQRFYINPINKLKKDIKGEGFPIVTVQCALIETFAAFKEGKVYDRSKEENGIYYKDSRQLFVYFLESEKLFLNNFSGNNPRADKFYADVRCGLMHETRSKKDWVIKKQTPLNMQIKILIVRKILQPKHLS
jgi:hypothetical protein